MDKNKRCENCENCIAMGEGDFGCDYNGWVTVIENYLPTEFYLKCKGRYFKEESNGQA